MARELDELPRIPWRPEFVADAVPHLVRGYYDAGPLFGLDVPGANPGMVFMVGPEANERVLMDVDTFWWGPVYAAVRKIWGEVNLVCNDGELHDKWRRLMQPMVTGQSLVRQYGMMRDVVTHHVDTWADQKVDMHAALRDLIFEIAARAFCGIEDRDLMSEFTSAYEDMMGVASDPMVNSKFDMDESAGERVRALLKPLIRAARGRETRANVLELLANTPDDDGSDLPDEDIASQALVLMLAGHETTASVSSFLLYLLGANPESADRLRAEIAEFPDETSVGLLRRSPYLNCVLMETERLYPPLPLTGRTVMQDVEFAGFRIPAGVSIQLSAAASHRLPHVFADPDRYDPDRFAEPRLEHRKTKWGLIGFAGGPRVCLGMPFAKVEMGEILTQIYRRYDWSLVNHAPPKVRRGQTAVPGSPIEIEFASRA